VGYDHSLGKGASGNAETIAELGATLGYSTEVIGPTEGSTGALSSSRIRNALHENGNVVEASRQLGRAYSLTGRVIRGDGRGKQLGFPTANLALVDPDKVVPANGVYAVRVRRPATDADHDGIMNIGVRPTLTDGHARALEVHILGFDEDIYGELLTVSFIERIRDERKFDGIDALRRQIAQDLDDCIRILRVVSYLD